MPDFALEATLSRAIDLNTGQGEDGPPQLSNVSLSGLEGADYAVEGGIACALASIPEQAIADTILPALTNWYSAATHLCATAGPYWWQPCPPSVQVSW